MPLLYRSRAYCTSQSVHERVKFPLFALNKKDGTRTSAIKMTPAELQEVLDWAFARSDSKAAREEARSKFLPDVSKYEGKVYVHLHLDLYPGGRYNSHEIMNEWEFNLLREEDPTIGIGEHCTVSVKWSDLVESHESNACNIAALDYVHHMKDYSRAENVLCERLDELAGFCERELACDHERPTPVLSESEFYDFVVAKYKVKVELLGGRARNTVGAVFSRKHPSVDNVKVAAESERGD
jgi:hypothetical protein